MVMLFHGRPTDQIKYRIYMQVTGKVEKNLGDTLYKIISIVVLKSGYNKSWILQCLR